MGVEYFEIFGMKIKKALGNAQTLVLQFPVTIVNKRG